MKRLKTAGAAEAVSRERLLVDTKRKHAIPLQGSVNGFAVGQGLSRLFVALNHEILLFDLTAEETGSGTSFSSPGPKRVSEMS